MPRSSRASSKFQSHQQNCFIFGKRLPRNNKASSNFQVKLSKLLYFVKNFSLWYRGRSNFCVTSSKLPIFAKISALDNRACSKVQVTSSKLFFKQKVQLVIAAAVLQFSSAEMTYFWLISADDNRCNKFSNHFLKSCVFCENFNSWLQGQLKFSSECIRLALF